jgi:hypothetical protein
MKAKVFDTLVFKRILKYTKPYQWRLLGDLPPTLKGSGERQLTSGSAEGKKLAGADVMAPKLRFVTSAHQCGVGG